MNRFATVLIALLALVALSTAAGTFQSAGGPSLTGDGSLSDGTGNASSPPGGPTGGGPGGSVGVGGWALPAGAAAGAGGVSALVVALVVGALAVAGLLVVLLTGDDARADRPDRGGAAERESPAPAVDPTYGDAGDNAVFRAWRRLTDRVDDGDASTPAETERRARSRGFPPDAVAELAAQFRAVRYGPHTASEERERRATAAVERLDDDGETA